MKKVLALCLSGYSALAIAGFDVVALGVDGGVSDGNLTSYLIRSDNQPQYVALDAGSLLPGGMPGAAGVAPAPVVGEGVPTISRNYLLMFTEDFSTWIIVLLGLALVLVKNKVFHGSFTADPDLAPRKLIAALGPYMKNDQIFHCPSNPRARIHTCRNGYNANGSPFDNQHDPFYMSYRFYNSPLCGEVAPTMLDMGGRTAKDGFGCNDTGVNAPRMGDGGGGNPPPPQDDKLNMLKKAPPKRPAPKL